MPFLLIFIKFLLNSSNFPPFPSPCNQFHYKIFHQNNTSSYQQFIDTYLLITRSISLWFTFQSQTNTDSDYKLHSTAFLAISFKLKVMALNWKSGLLVIFCISACSCANLFTLNFVQSTNKVVVGDYFYKLEYSVYRSE